MHALKNMPVLFFIAAGMTACTFTEKPETAIHTAAQAGNADQIRRIIKQHPGLVNHQNPGKNARQRTPLHEANNSTVVKVLLDHGANVHAKDCFDWTPLHTAADGEVVDLLVSAGGNVHARAARGLTPLHTVENPDAATALLRRGADIEALASQKTTPLMWQIQMTGNPEVIAVLVAKHANVTVKASLGRTLLHLAGGRKMPETVRLLLEKGADVNARDEINATPLHYAAQNGHLDVAKILLQYGADPTFRLSDDAVVTHFSFATGSSPQRKSIAGLTALDLAESEPMKTLLQSQ